MNYTERMHCNDQMIKAADCMSYEYLRYVRPSAMSVSLSKRRQLPFCRILYATYDLILL